MRLSTLARAFHYNETYLSRMLQNYMGMSFTEIVRGIKMTRAEEYLSTSTLRIHDISALVGYDSVDHFSRTFKSTHNMSPQAYRRLTTKRGLRTELNRPKFAIMNPELAMTLPKYQIASGATDILAHIMERYFTSSTDERIILRIKLIRKDVVLPDLFVYAGLCGGEERVRSHRKYDL